jgi:membrane protein YdbS with pleckstrin-like domain
MENKILKPSPRYLTKLRVIVTLVAALAMVVGLFIGLLVSLEARNGLASFALAFLITAGVNLVWWLPAMILVGPYYRSLSYEIQDDETIVRAGIVTRSVKHVPYRTVTNLTVQRGPLDRWLFDLGTLKIQTAGMSGQTGAEESLAGLPNVQEVYETVAGELRRFRGGMAPTAADLDAAPDAASPDVLGAILAEVRSIRQALEDR